MGSFSQLRGDVTFNADASFVLTDGSVFITDRVGLACWRLTPAADGGYDNGSWSSVPTPTGAMRDVPAGMVLRDGRLWLWLFKGPSVAEIFDPVTKIWSPVAAPPGWFDRDSEITVRASIVLADGRVLCKSGLEGNVPTPDPRATWLFDPSDSTWLRFPDPDPDTDILDRESWTLLPDRSVLAIQWNKQRSKRFLGDRWIATAPPPPELFTLYPPFSDDTSPFIRRGVQLLVADGKVLVLSAEGQGAYYVVPKTGLEPGSWLPGPKVPTFPDGTPADPEAVALLPNGHVLVQCTPVGRSASPAGVWDFDGTTFNPVVIPYLMSFIGVSCNTLLPNGQLLFTNGSLQKWLYTPDAPARADLAPEITSYPHWLVPGAPQELKGRRLNGVSQAVDTRYAIAATNYPLVRLTALASGKVTYCRTFDHSSLGVATGDAEITTHFELPPGLALGRYRLCVCANGLSSCVEVEVKLAEKPDILVKIGPRFQIGVVLGGIVIGGEDDGSQWVIGPGGIRGPTPGWDPRSSNPAGGVAAGLAQGLSALAGLIGRLRGGN